MVSKKRFLAVAAVLSFIVGSGGCATVSKHPPISAEREAYLKDLCQQNDIAWQWDQISQVVILKYRGAQARLLVGSNLVLFGEERVILDSPIRTVQSSVVVPIDFGPKVVARLRREAGKKKELVIPAIRRIVIDAGHGGKDPGAIGRTGLQEKGVVLDICQQLGKILRQQGFQIKLTRDDDRFLTLEERAEIASRANADLFVSVHANASPTHSVYGFESYSAQELGFSDRLTAERKRNEELMFDNLSMKKNASDVQKIVADMLYEHKQRESAAAAEYVTEATAKFIKTKDRGAKTARFYVLRNTLVPAVLVEVGFLSNPKEEKLLGTPSYRQKIAQGLARSISDYANTK